MPVTWIAIRLGKTRVHAGAASTDPHVEQHRNARAATWRALRSLVSGEGLASAAAGGGEPAPLLTRYAYGLSIDPSRPPALRHEVGEDNHRRYGMPVTRIAIRQGRSHEFKQALMDEIYEAMRETIHIKDGDRFMTITEHGASEFAYGSFLDIERTDDLVQVQIFWAPGKTVVDKLAMYKAIARRLAGNPGVRPEDILICVVETSAEDWSFGNGDAQFYDARPATLPAR